MSGEGIHNPADVGDIETDLGTALLYLLFIYGEVVGLDGDAMRGTDNATLQATWTDAMATALANYTAVRAGYLDQLDFNLQEAIAALQTDLDNPNQYKADVAALALEATLGTHDTDIKALLATIASYIDTEIAAITPAGPTLTQMNTAHDLLATEAKQDIIDTNVDQIEALVATTVAGKPQIVVDSTDWDSLAAGTYALVTAVAQDVIIESITLYTTRDLSGDAGFTGVSYQTDATTPAILISQANGVKANLTAEGQVYSGGLAVLLKPGTYIEFTVYGGAVASVASLVDVVITYKAVVDGGYIA